MKHAGNSQAGPIRRLAYQSGPIWRLARNVSDFFSDWAYAQHRVFEVTTAPDRYMLNPDVAPENYAEFLQRTSGVLHHEPPARCRVGR
jgi:hypothetical protein